MKILKIFSVLALSAVTISMSAALNAKAQLVFTSNEAATNYLISQDDAVADDFSSTNCKSPEAAVDAYSVSAYTEYGAKKYAAVELKNINGTVIKFQTNPYETQYTLTISNVVGGVKILKGGIEVTSPLVLNAPADFTVGEIIEFTVSVPGYTRTVTSGDYGTLCLPFASTAVEGADIYTVAGKDADTNPTGLYLQEYTGNLVAGTPYVFQATAAELKVTYAAGDSVAATAVNGLVGSFTEENIAAGMYIIDENQLKKTADATCKVRANGAYFDFSQMSVYTPQPGAPVRFMSIKGAPTSVAEVAAPAMKEGKMILNGQMVIVRDGKMFNAQGAAL